MNPLAGGVLIATRHEVGEVGIVAKSLPVLDVVERVMAEQLVFVGQLMVDTDITLVVVNTGGAHANVVEAAQGIRQGELRRRKELV